MKHLLIIAAGFIGLVSCKKSSPANPGLPGTRQYQAGYYYEFNGIWQWKGYILFDLNHDDNLDKKYIVINALLSKDSFYVIKSNLPIDSLAANWPASVKSVAYGASSDMVVDAYTRIRASSVVNGRISYRYDSLHKFIPLGLQIYYFNDPNYAGSMAGVKPEGEAFIRIPNISDPGSTLKQCIFYFSKGVYTNVSGYSNGGPKSLSSLAPGAANFDWKSVSTVISVRTSSITSRHMFLDFTNWRYFYLEERCLTPTDCTQLGITWVGYKSLDELIQWPAGWK